jgi:dolichol-phosphate mannosyltransferase
MKKNISIVIATLNEEGNINKLFHKIKKNLINFDITWEIIFVDDSADNKTSNEIYKLKSTEDNIHLIKRYENNGLSSALTLGAMSSNSDYVVFMDADLQHPPEKIKDLYYEIKSNKLNLVSASRFLRRNNLLNEKRYRASLIVNYILKKLFNVNYSDFLTGFFIIDCEFFKKNQSLFSKVGFKLLLDIILSTKKTIKFSEIPFEFQKRYSGYSKLNTKVVIDFIILIIDKMFGNFKLGNFCFQSILIYLIANLQLSFFYLSHFYFSLQTSLLLSIFLVIYFNFIIYNEIVYSSLKKKGKVFYVGLTKFYFICIFGSFFNFIIAKFLIDNSFNTNLAVLFGAFFGSLWNSLINRTIR